MRGRTVDIVVKHLWMLPFHFICGFGFSVCLHLLKYLPSLDGFRTILALFLCRTFLIDVEGGFHDTEVIFNLESLVEQLQHVGSKHLKLLRWPAIPDDDIDTLAELEAPGAVRIHLRFPLCPELLGGGPLRLAESSRPGLGAVQPFLLGRRVSDDFARFEVARPDNHLRAPRLCECDEAAGTGEVARDVRADVVSAFSSDMGAAVGLVAAGLGGSCSLFCVCGDGIRYEADAAAVLVEQRLIIIKFAHVSTDKVALQRENVELVEFLPRVAELDCLPEVTAGQHCKLEPSPPVLWSALSLGP